MAVYVFSAIVLLGISLLFFCLSRFGGKIRLYVIRRSSALAGLHKVRLWWNSQELEFLEAIFGGLLCSIIAALFCVSFRKSSLKGVAPICFLPVIAGISVRFGSMAGILGTLLSELIFAVLFFEPLHSLAVQDQVERNNLIWMFLGGLALSQLFGHSPKGGKTGKP